MSFEPDILGFACNWCGYAGADGAGQAKLPYSSNVKLIRVMCLGRVDTAFMLHGLEEGYDGVILVGCHIGSCHYVSGNINATEIVKNAQKMLGTLGIGAERLRMVAASASEGPEFAAAVRRFEHELIALGPNPLKKA